MDRLELLLLHGASRVHDLARRASIAAPRPQVPEKQLDENKVRQAMSALAAAQQADQEAQLRRCEDSAATPRHATPRPKGKV